MNLRSKIILFFTSKKISDIFLILILIGSVLYKIGYKTLGSVLMGMGVIHGGIGLVILAIQLYLALRASPDKTVSLVFGFFFVTWASTLSYGWLIGLLYIDNIINNIAIFIITAILGILIIVKIIDVYFNKKFPSLRYNKYVEYISREEHYGGFTFPLGMKAFVLVGGADPQIIEMIKIHEEYHAINKHNLKQILFIYILFVFFSFLIKYNLWGTILSPLYFVTTMVAFLVLTRVFEVSADAYMWRRLGPEAYERFKAFLKARYGVEEPWKAPWWSRLTHTSRRDITMTTGDPIGAHWELEFPLLFSLISATLLALFLERSPLFSPLAVYAAPSTIAGSLVAIFLLALVLRPLVRRFVDSRFTDRGVFNLSALLSGLLFTTSFSSIFLGPLIYPPMYAVTAYFMRHYLASWRKALSLSGAGFAVLLAINALLFLLLPRA